MTPVSSGSPAAGAAPYITGRGRDLRIDLLRGVCVIAMIIEHISGASPLYYLTGGGIFLTGVAEGFILLSGYTAGLVYRPLIESEGIGPAIWKILRRVFGLYLLTVGLTLLIVPLSEYFHLPWAMGYDLSRSLEFLISVLTLHTSYTFVNIMTLFTLLFLALPAALVLLQQGRGRVLLLVSWLVWLAFELYPDPATFPWTILAGRRFAFSSFQALFFTMVVLGYTRDRLPALRPMFAARLHWLTGAGTVAFIAFFAVMRLPVEQAPAGLQGRWAGLQHLVFDVVFAKAQLGPGRLIATAVVYGFLFLSLTRWWRPLSRVLGPLALPFGRHALYAWTAHILVVIALGLVMTGFGIAEDLPWLNAFLQIAVIAFVWLLLRRQPLALNATNRRYWYAVPAVLAVLALAFLQLPAFQTPHSPTTGVSSQVVEPDR